METKIESKRAWLSMHDAAKEHMDKLRKKIRDDKKHRLLKDASDSTFKHPVMQEFKDLIDNDAIVRMNFTKMIDQVPGFYKKEGESGVYLESIDEMLNMIDIILGKAPEYNNTDIVGFPINCILNWTMGVPAGAAAFRNEKVNAMFRKIFAVWTEFLDSNESSDVFEPGGSWRSEEALAKLDMSQYLEYPDADKWPYQSWNKFFTRKFYDYPSQRPIYEPDNDKAIVAACDSKVYNIQFNAKLQNWFWVKSQPYSLQDMLANEDENKRTQSNKEHFNDYVKPFEGGDVFHAFLSAFKYHRWHSPVSGTIRKAYVKEGTYYSATQAEGLDQASPDLSQGYIAHTATRALFYIEADNSKIGLMCAIFIGMAEVSSCIIRDKDDKDIKPGDRIEKGDQLGYFQHGGSTHCLVFRKGVIENGNFTDNQNEKIKINDEIKMGQRIALVS